MDDILNPLVIVMAATFVAAILLTIAFDIPVKIAAIFVIAVFAVSIEYYIRSKNRS